MTSGIDAGELAWRIAIMRRAASDDGMSSAPGEPMEVGRRWARKDDVSDAERVRAAAQQVAITTRFLVRFDSLTATIGPDDQIVCDGMTYEVTGTKEARGRRVGIEITATVLR